MSEDTCIFSVFARDYYRGDMYVAVDSFGDIRLDWKAHQGGRISIDLEGDTPQRLRAALTRAIAFSEPVA